MGDLDILVDDDAQRDIGAVRELVGAGEQNGTHQTVHTRPRPILSQRRRHERLQLVASARGALDHGLEQRPVGVAAPAARAGFARAVNDWMKAEWLDKEPRLRASIVVPAQSPEMAVDEINRLAHDKRFVQVLLLVMNDMPLGKRHYWPIYAAAEKHGLAIGIHAGSAYRHPVTSIGWPSYYTEDYAAQSTAFQQALSSLICEGVFVKYPDLKVVLLESGFTWLPAHLWRLTKFWRGLRMEVPWLDRAPSDIVKSNVRLTIQPCDGPPSEAMFQKLMEHMDSDELLLFSTDYPHWQFDGEDVLPPGLSRSLVRKIMIDNPRATYSRLAVG